MGSWGDKTERRGDRMPKAHIPLTEPQVQAQTVMLDPVQQAMMDDLGDSRINNLPLDNTHGHHYIPPRPRRAPVITESSEALDGYRAFSQNGINDSEAKAVEGLDPLGGGDAYRPTGGPSRDYVETRRPNGYDLRGYQTSSNGILLVPGAPVRQFPAKRNNEETVATRTINTAAHVSKPAASQVPPAVTKTLEQRNTVINTTSVVSGSQPADKRLPPHLRAKKAPEPSSLTGPLTQAPEQSVPGVPVAPATTGLPSVKQEEITKDEPLVSSTKADNPPQKEGRMYWSGSCQASISGKATGFQEVIIEMKPDRETQGAIFIMKGQEFQSVEHDLSYFVVVFHKNQQCIIKFSSAQEAPEARYSLKFADAEKSKEFVEHASTLQKAFQWIREIGMDSIGGVSTPQAKVAQKEPAEAKTPVAEAIVTEPVVTEPVVTQPVITEQVVSEPVTAPKHVDKPSMSVNGITNASANEGDPKIDGMVDAFNDLHLNNVKMSKIYQYSREELKEKRSGARTPPGIENVKLPLAKDDQTRLPPHMQRNRPENPTPTSNRSGRDPKMVRDWLSGATTILETKAKGPVPEHQEAVVSVAETSQTQRETRIKEETVLEMTTSATSTLQAVVTDTNDQSPPEMTAVMDESQALIEETTVMEESHAPPEETAVMEESHAPPEETTVMDESLPLLQTVKSEATTVVEVEQSTQDKEDAATVTVPVSVAGTQTEAPAAPVVIPAPTGLMDAPIPSAQPAPAMAPTMPVDHMFGSHASAHRIPGMPPQMATPQMSTPQMATPQMTTAHMAQPQTTFYSHQMQGQQMMPGMQHLPPMGVIHAVSITYHVSPVEPGSTQPDAGQTPIVRNATDFTTTEPGTAFSPSATPFHPSSGVPRSSEPRIRRGLESSMFATGHHGAKFAGSFTGGQ